MTEVRWVGAAGALLCGLAVALGAFGAHVLQDALTAQRLATFDTATRYQFFQGIGLLLVQLLHATRSLGQVATRRLGGMFLAGVLVFCGALYLLVTGAPSWLGAVAPVGGVLMVAGWLTLALSLWRSC